MMGFRIRVGTCQCLRFSNLTRKNISWNILLEFFRKIIDDASSNNLSRLPPQLIPMGGEGPVEWSEETMAMPSSAGIGARVSDVVIDIGGLYGARRGHVEASCLPKNLLCVPL
jgi:hypothetical protein